MSYPQPFHWWVENVLPLVYDGSLSYYEVLSKVTEYINGLTADMSEVKTEIENIDAIIETLDPERIETLLTEVDTLATAVSGMESRVGTLEDDNSDNQENINTLNTQVSTLQSNVSTLGTNVENFGDRLGNVEEQVSDYNERISDAENLAQTASSNTAALGLRVNEAEAKIENVEDKADNYSSAIAESEEWFIATRSYTAHDLVFVGSTLYEVISDIAIGDSLTIGTNIKAVTVSENNKEIKDAINTMTTNLSALNDNVDNNSEDIESLQTDVNDLKTSVHGSTPNPYDVILAQMYPENASKTFYGRKYTIKDSQITAEVLSSAESDYRGVYFSGNVLTGIRGSVANNPPDLNNCLPISMLTNINTITALRELNKSVVFAFGVCFVSIDESNNITQLGRSGANATSYINRIILNKPENATHFALYLYSSERTPAESTRIWIGLDATPTAALGLALSN